MEKSIQTALLTREEIQALEDEQLGAASYGVLIAVFFGALVLLFFFFGAGIVTFSIGGLTAAAVAAFVFYQNGQNNLLKKDIIEGRKNVITAPIEKKDVKTSEITSGARQGEIESQYFMFVNGKKYKMHERDYLTIRKGEFVEIHEAPHSGIVLAGRWLRQTGEAPVELDFEEV